MASKKKYVKNRKKTNSRAVRKVQKANINVRIAKPSSAADDAIKNDSVKNEIVQKEPIQKEPIQKEPVLKKPATKINPAVETGFTSGRIIFAISMIAVFTMTYNMVLIPFAESNYPTAVTTEEVTTKAATTSATKPVTTQTTEPATETTRKPAAPVTKKYIPKTTRAVTVSASKKVLITVPYMSQLPAYPTGCEAASAAMLLSFYEYNVGVGTMISAIPRENLYEETVTLSGGEKIKRVYGPSIYQKFVGDPRMKYTSETPGYGAFAPVVTSAMNSVMSRNGGGHVAKNISGSALKTLFAYLDEGRPIIVWATYNMKTPEFVNSWYIRSADDNPNHDKYFEYPRGTHVMVLVGYDSGSVYILDPYSQGLKTFSQSSFSSKYSLLGNQAIVVLEQEVTTTELPCTTASGEDLTNGSTNDLTNDSTKESTNDSTNDLMGDNTTDNVISTTLKDSMTDSDMTITTTEMTTVVSTTKEII